MGLNETQNFILQSLGSSLVKSGEFQNDFWIQIQSMDLLKVVEFLRSSPELQFDSFVDLCGVDYLERIPRFEVVIHLYSSVYHHRIRIRCLVSNRDLTIPSLTSFWKASNWQEREAFDMYGIQFVGHPNLQRILSPPDTSVFAQRKDYPLKGSRDFEEES